MKPMPEFTTMSVTEAQLQTTSGRQKTFLHEYIRYIQQLPKGQAGKLSPLERENPATIRRRLQAAATALGAKLIIKHSGRDVYFWQEGRKDEQPRHRRGRKRRSQEETAAPDQTVIESEFPGSGNSVPLIPRRALFSNPDKALPKLSPSGSRISHLAPVNDVLNVWVGPADNIAAARPVTNDTKRGIRFYSWAYTDQHLLYIQDKDGDENWHVYSVDLITGQTKDLTPLDGVQAQIEALSHNSPSEIIVGLNNRDPQLHDLYRINIHTGERSLVQQNEGFSGFVIDHNYNVRLAVRMTPDGGTEFFQPGERGAWQPFMRVAMEDVLNTNPLGFDRTGKTLYLFDSRGRDTAALAAINFDSGEERILAEDRKADVSSVMIHPTEKHIQAVAFNHIRQRWHVLDDSIAQDPEYLSTVSEGDVEIMSRTLDDRHWIVKYEVDNGPVRYYLYDRDKGQTQFLFVDRKVLDGFPLAKMHPIIIKSRDGLDLVSYLTLPVWSNSEGDARSNRPLPMVLLVHGGPWHRDQWGYDPFHQWLANRGYAVLSVNFRGSTGFGKDFINAGNREWGGKMHEDLIDAVKWAIEERIAHPDHVAIMGGSYGGYATLVGMTFTPETFACGVDIVGPSSLVTLLESIPPYWQPVVSLFTTRIGDYRTEEGRRFLTECSPLTYVERINKPLLIGQGANDPRVKQAESDQIMRAMREKNIQVTYVLYPDEGHGFARPENNLSFYAAVEGFLAKHLGGQAEPAGDDFKGSSITVESGAEHIPGLVEAIQKT
jgi:dipeptidyl aminopeptidase/acylaminoacyl peptidase